MRRQRWFMESVGTEYDTGEERKPVDHEDESANLLSSVVEDAVNAHGIIFEDDKPTHMPVIDIDHPVRFLLGKDNVKFTRINVQHFEPVFIDHMAESLINLGWASAVHSDGRYNAIDIRWSVPVEVKPSWTPGHFHLYIDAVIHTDGYFKLLDQMADAGIVEHGYVEAARRRGATFVALKPWKDRHVARTN